MSPVMNYKANVRKRSFHHKNRFLTLIANYFLLLTKGDTNLVLFIVLEYGDDNIHRYFILIVYYFINLLAY